jgi:hypothetical protein
LGNLGIPPLNHNGDFSLGGNLAGINLNSHRNLPKKIILCKPKPLLT